jgi:DNA repair protein RadC
MEVAEISVSYSTNKAHKIKLTNCRDTFDFILVNWNLDIIEFQEECKIILVNRANFVLGIYELSKGGISGTIVDIRIILSVALKCNASGIILVHNHPSGNITASESDKKITRKLYNACELLDLVLIDHFIICKNDFLFHP